MAFAFLLLAGGNWATAQGTTFTYQGRLSDGANPANGSYDLMFTLWNAASGPAQIGDIITSAATTVSNGLFTVALDFGNQFPGGDRWLEIGVRPNGGGAFLTLSPRQHLTATPYAITAGNVVSGGIAAGAYSNAVTFNNPANQFIGAFKGNGSGLTNMNPGKVIYASTLPGIHLNTSLVSGGGSDDWAILQAALDKTTNNFPLTLVLDGPALLTKTLVLHSNVTLYALQNCGAFLSNYCDVPIVSNDLNTNYSSKNITLIGGTWNCNGTSQNRYQKHIDTGGMPDIATGFYVMGMWFAGVSNLVVRDIEIVQPMVDAFYLNDSRDVKIDGMFVNYLYAESSFGGGGLHFFGNVQDVNVNNFKGNAPDDNITFDANSNQAYYLTNTFANPDKLCIQSNILIDGVTTFKGGPFWTRCQVLNFQNQNDFNDFNEYSTISDVTIRNVHSTDATVLFRGAIYGGCNFVFENFNVQYVAGSGSAVQGIAIYNATNVLAKNWVVDTTQSGVSRATLFGAVECSNVVVSGVLANFGTNAGSSVLNGGGSSAVAISDVTQLGGKGFMDQTPGTVVANNIVISGGTGSINPDNMQPPTFTIGTFSCNGTTSFSIINTNFIDGFRYTNGYGVPISISANAGLHSSGNGGVTTLRLIIGNGSSSSAASTTATGVQDLTNTLSGFVPAGAGYWFTNESSIASGTVTVIGGQIFIY